MSFGLGLNLNPGGGGGKYFYLPGGFDSRWVVSNATPSQEYTKTVWLTIVGAGAISVIGDTTWSDDGVTYTADPGTISTGRLWVKLAASASYETLVEGGVTIDTAACPFDITTMVEPVTTFDDLTEAQFDALTEEEFDALT